MSEKIVEGNFEELSPLNSDVSIIPDESLNSPYLQASADKKVGQKGQNIYKKVQQKVLSTYVKSIIDLFSLEEQEVDYFLDELGKVGIHSGIFFSPDWNCFVFLDPTRKDGQFLTPLKGSSYLVDQKIKDLLERGLVWGDGEKMSEKIREVKASGCFSNIRMNFDPHGPKIFENTSGIYELNIFSPTKIMQKAYKAREELGTHSDFAWLQKYPCIFTILKNLCVTPDRIAYFLNWLSFIFNKLEKTGNAIVFKGAQGTGKTLFFNRIISYFMGDKFCATLSNDDIDSKFTSPKMRNTLFICFNEVKCGSNEGNKSYEKLKMYITDDKLRIERKGVDSDEIKNCFNCLFYSNHAAPLQVQKGDRRYTVFNTNNENLKLVVERDMGIDMIEFLKSFEAEKDDFIIDVVRLAFNEVEAMNTFDTEEKTALQRISDTKQNQLTLALQAMDDEFFEELIQKAEDDWFFSEETRDVILEILNLTKHKGTLINNMGVFMRQFIVCFRKFVEINGCAPAADVEFITRMFFLDAVSLRSSFLSPTELGKKLDGTFGKSKTKRVKNVQFNLIVDEEKTPMKVRSCPAWERHAALQRVVNKELQEDLEAANF